MNNKIIDKLVSLVEKADGKVYYVGGYVRDYLLGIKNKDIDLEVHGIEEDKLIDILKEIGTPLEYGKEFGIYSLADTNIEIALPRSEKKSGEGHRDFDVKINPYIGIKEAARRRDFTINSMMLDASTNELLDPYNGKSDLENRIIRHVDKKTFIEDPLRVFRAAQFASRLGFVVANDTIELCKTMDETKLSKERVEEELKKALLKSDKPSLFFDYLTKMNKLDYWFKELKACIGYEQNPKKHPEGDVYKHTMMALDEGALYRNEVSDPYRFMLLLVVHDFGKLKTKIMTEEGIHFYGHENYLDDIKEFLNRLTNNKEVKNYILEMVPKHMRGHKIYKNNLDEYESNIWFDGVKYPKDLAYLATSDKSNHKDETRLPFLLKRFEIYQEANNNLLKGIDLINSGISQSDSFKEYLSYAKDLSFHGINRSEVLTKTIDYIKNRT